MADELKDQRVVTMMSPSELQAIDDWMFANRIRSRAEAIRRLCRIGLIFDEEIDPYDLKVSEIHFAYMELVAGLADLRDQDPDGVGEALEPTFEVLGPLTDAIHTLIMRLEAAADAAEPYRQTRDLQAAMTQALETRVQTSVWRKGFEDEIAKNRRESLSDLVNRLMAMKELREKKNSE